MPVNIYRLKGEVTLDSKPAETKLKSFESAVKSTVASLNTGASGAAKFGADLGAAGNKGAAAFRAVNTDVGKVTSALSQARSAARKAAGDFKGLDQAVGGSVNAFASLGRGDFGGFFRGLSELPASFSAATKGAGGLQTAIAGAAVAGGALAGTALGAVALGTTFINLARQGSALAGEMRDLSLTTGMSVEGLSRLKIIAGQSGTDIGSLTSGISQLQEKMQDAVSGNKQLSALFKSLGVDAKTAGKDPQAAFEKLGSTIAGIRDPILRTKTATEVFGDAGAKLIPVFSTLRDDGSDLTKRMQQLGLTLSGDVVKSADRVGDEFTILGAVADRLKIQVAHQMAPEMVRALQDVENGLVKITPIIGMIGESFAASFSQATGWVDSLAHAIDSRLGAGMLQLTAIGALSAIGIKGGETSTWKRQPELDRGSLEPRNPKAAADPYAAIRSALAGGGGRRRGVGGGGALSEFDQLSRSLKEVNKDLSGLQNVGSREFKLRMQLEDKRDLRGQLLEIIDLRRTLGEPVAVKLPMDRAGASREIEKLMALKQIQALAGKGDVFGPLGASARVSSEAFSRQLGFLDRLITDSLPRVKAETVSAALAQNDFFLSLTKTNSGLAEYYQKAAASADITISNARALDGYSAIHDQLMGQMNDFRNMTVQQTTALQLQDKAYKDLSGAQRGKLLEMAGMVDAQNQMRDFADTTRDLFTDLFTSGPEKFFDSMANKMKQSMAKMAADFATNTVMKLLFGAGGQQPGFAAVGGGGFGAVPQSPGGGLMGAIFNRSSGNPGQAASLALPGGGVPATPGIAGGGGAADILGNAQSAVGMFQKGGMVSKLPLGKAGGFLKGLPGIGGALGKLGGFLGLGGGGAASAAGAGGAAAGGAGGAAGMAGLGAMFSNPVTAIIAGGIIAAPFIAKLFAKDPLSDYKKHIKSIYGVDVKSKSILTKVMQAGQSKFGTEWQKRQVETVKLPEIRDMIHEHSQAFMLGGGNSSLFSMAEYGDRFSAVNQFKVGMRAMGGPVTAGMPYVVGERRAELFVPDQNGRIEPSVRGGGGGGGWTAKMQDALASLAETQAQLTVQLSRMKAISKGQMVEMGIAERPGVATRDVVNSYKTRDEHSQQIKEMNGVR